MIQTGPSTTFHARVVALYATDAHAKPALDDAEFDRLVARGIAALGNDTVTRLAREMTGIETAWALGHLTDETYTTALTALWPDQERLLRCYGHAIGEPYP